jgi:hypothetical protein
MCLPKQFQLSEPRLSGSFVGLAVLALAISGCGDGMAEVTGKVTLDGEPLASGNGVRATVYFQPESGDGVAAVGILDQNGQYTLSSGSKDGVAPGVYRVTCTASQIIRSKDPNGAPSGRRITDPKYANAQTSGFQFTVEPGRNEFDLALDSLPHARPMGSR